MNEKQDLSYITIEDKTIPVVLERKERKTLSIGIQEDGSLMIKAPLYMKQEIMKISMNYLLPLQQLIVLCSITCISATGS